MSDTSDGQMVSNQIELSPSAPHTNIPYLLPSNNDILPFSSDPSNQDLFLTAAPSSDNTPLIITAINCRDEDSTSQASQFPDVDLLCLQSPIKYDTTRTAAAPSMELLLQFDDLLAPPPNPSQPLIQLPPPPLSGQNGSSLPSAPEQSDSGGSGDQFDTPPSTPSWNTDGILDTPGPEKVPLAPATETSIPSIPVSPDDVILTPPKGGVNTAPPQSPSPPAPPQTAGPRGSMLLIHGMDVSVSVERLRLHLWLYRASVILVELHTDPADPGLRLGVVKFRSSQLADQLTREFSQLPICGQTHRTTASVCDLPAPDIGRDTGEYLDSPCSVMEGAPVPRERRTRPPSPASRAFSPDTGMRLDPNRVPRDSGKFQRMDPATEGEPKIHSIIITNISNIDHPMAASVIRTYVMNWWEIQIQSIICTEDQVRPNCAIMYINTFHKNLPELILEKLRTNKFVFPPLEANIRWNSSWTGHRNQNRNKRTRDTSPSQEESFNTHDSFQPDMEFDNFSHPSAPPLSPPERAPCTPPQEETALLLHKVMSPVNQESLSTYFRDFLVYTVSWEAVSLEGEFKCVRVVFSNGEVADAAKQSLEHTPFNGAYVVFSIGTDADIQQQQQQQQCLSSPQHRSTPDDAYLMITGFDDFITTEYFEAHSIIKRYSEHYSEIRVQTNRDKKMKRIRVKFHNRDAVIAAETSFLQVEFRGKQLDAKIEHIGQTESPVSPVKPTVSPVKPTVPIIVVSSIPPDVTSSDIAFLFKPFGLVKKEIDIKPMEHNSALGQCKVVFENAESASTAVQVKHGITYRGHILDVKLLSDLIQPATEPPAALPSVETEERRPQTHSVPTQKDTFIEGDMSKELYSYFSDNFKSEIERFSQLGQLNHSGNTLALKHTDGTALHQFIDNYINEISESNVELSEEDLKLLHSPEQQNTPGTNIDKLVGAFKETGHIDYIVGHFPSSLLVFGHKKTVAFVTKNINIFLCSQLEIQCPLNLFFNKFPECLYPDSSKFEFKEIKLRINSGSLDECRLIRKHIDGVIASCCTCEIKMTQKFLKPAHIFITRNGLQVSLLLKTPDGKYLDQATKSIEGAVVCLCGVNEHISSLVEVLENPCEESMTVSQNALLKLTKKRDKGSILLERFEAKSKVCIRLEKRNNIVVISGFIKEDVKAMVEELGKKLEDVRVTIPDSCLKKIQKFYLINGQTKDPNVVSEIIQDLEVQFQLKVEFQNQIIQLSGDQDAILSFESNTRELEQFFSCRIPQRTFHKVVLESNGQQFAQLIFAYLDYLSKDTFFIFEVITPQPMANRVGSSDIQIIATAHPPAVATIEQKIKVIRPRSDTVKSTKEDFHLFISAVEKFEVIKKNEFVEIIPNPKCHSLEFLSIGVCVKSAQELFASGISDQEDRRNVTITAHLALYIRKKGIINQLTSKFDCNLRLEDRGNSFTCLVQMDGKRDAIEKVSDHINALKNSINCKPFQLKYPSKKFFNQFQAEVVVVIDFIQEKFRVIIDARNLSVRGDSDKDCEVIIISECTPDVDQAISQLKDFLAFEKSTHPLTPIQHRKLVDDMLPILSKQSCAGHYYLDLTRENLVIMALKYFAKEAIPNGDFNLETYIKYSCAEYRVPNLPIFHTLRIPQSVQKIDAIGKNNSVKIHPPQTMTEPYKFEGNHDNVSLAFSEMEKYVQELSQFFGICNIPVSYPIDALTADSDIGGFLESLSLPDPAILVTLPQGDSRPMAQQLIASYEIPLHTHNLILEIRSGDITKLKVDSIVNAANDRLSHGAGVASAISTAGGPIVQQSSDQFIQQNGPLPVSGNVVLPPGNIQCKSIIHAVGPVWDQMKADQVKNELGNCILNICATANSACYSSIALPAISAGIYGFPLDESTSIIIKAIQQFFMSQQFYSINKLILIDIKDSILQQFKIICDNCFKQTTPIPLPQPKLIPVKSTPPKVTLPTPPQLTFQWCENDGTWKPYSDSNMQKLRLAYTSDPTGTASISRSNYTYTVDFPSMLQSNDQTAVQRNMRVVNSCAPDEEDYVISSEAAPLTQPPSSWKDIRTETVMLYGRKDRLNEARETFEDLVKQLMKKTEFDVTHVSRSDLIPIMSACKCPFVKLALDESTAGALKVIVEGYYKEVKTTETEIQANLMRLMQEQTPNLEGPPSNWEQNGTDEVCQLVLVQPPNPEYSEIVNKFRSTLPNANILRVDRIQNSWLWTRYQQDKHRLVQKSSTGANEVIVYHGTRGNPPVHIYRGEQGFEARLASSGMWGTASYFAVDASYSDSYAYKTPEGNKQMFSVKICAGDVIVMQPDTTLRLPPLKSAATAQIQPPSLMQQVSNPFQNPPMSMAPPSSLQVLGATSQTAPQFVNDRYDTVSGQTSGSKVYMIYENGRAYPEYLITYR